MTTRQLSLLLLMLIAVSQANAATVDKEKIRQVMKKHEKQVRDCYEAEIDKDPKVSGKIVLDWDVDDKGKVTKSSINEKSTTLKNNAVRACMLEHLKAWEFPAAPTGQTVSVSYPWFFTH